jgi:hypothetical protein
MRKLAVVSMVVLGLTLAGDVMAQQNQKGARNGTGPLIDTTEVVVVDGVVLELVAGPGQGMPTLAVEDAEGVTYDFVLGPYWYLTQEGFVAAPGDAVSVTAYACPLCDTGLAVASVANLTQNLTLLLRDADGAPLWVKHTARRGLGGGRNGNGPGSGNGSGGGNQSGASDRTRSGSGPLAVGPGGVQGEGAASWLRERDLLHIELSRMATFSGTVVSFTKAPAGGPGTLVLATGSGDATFLLSPFWVLLEAGFQPDGGDALEVVAAPVTLDGEEFWLALTITDPGTGLTIVLRDPATGLPVGSFGRRNGHS